MFYLIHFHFSIVRLQKQWLIFIFSFWLLCEPACSVQYVIASLLSSTHPLSHLFPTHLPDLQKHMHT